MQILYSPQRSDDTIEYQFQGEKITVTIGDTTDTFDFSSFPDGIAEIEEIETILPINPIISAERVDGELRVVLLYYHGADATQDELFPEWQEV